MARAALGCRLADSHHSGGALPPFGIVPLAEDHYFQAFSLWYAPCIFKWRKEGKEMKKTMLATMLLAAGSLFAGPRVAIGLSFGAPAPVVAVRPACPGPGYTWINGYYGPSGVWVGGYWAPPAVVVAPRIAPRVVVPEHHFVRGFDRGHDFRR